MIIIDSDVLIWILRNNQKYIAQYKSMVENSHGQLFITPIQYMEIIAGVRDNEIIQTELFLDSIGMINVTKEIGKLAGKFLSKYKKSNNVQSADALIGSTVKSTGYRLWSLNLKHYPMLNKHEFLSL